MTLPQQYDLFGNRHAAGDVIAKIRHLLETDEGTRDSYAELVGRYWLEFDGLDLVIPVECHEAFLRWLSRATSWKTIQNRTMEIQRNAPDLDASPEVRELRQRQARQGVVR